MPLEKPTVLDSAQALNRIQDDLGRIAQALVAASSAEAGTPRRPSTKLEAGTIRTVIWSRKLRDRMLRSKISDGTWDMILEAMAARLEGQRLTVSSLCMAAAVPTTTALRYIAYLVQDGIFIRRPDPEDPRRTFVELTDEAAKQVEAYFDTIREIGVSPL